jgi:NAD(P)-dependent dehydrogenase (short-subunit alcohol dehydrogenase family)
LCGAGDSPALFYFKGVECVWQHQTIRFGISSGDIINSRTQTALITGSSGGIGYELAKLFARDRYNLVLVARSADTLHRVAVELQDQFGVVVKTVSLDLTAGRTVVISGAQNWLFAESVRFAPRKMVTAISRWVAEKVE